MTKKIVITIVLIITLFVVYKSDIFTFAPILNISNKIKVTYLEGMEGIKNMVDVHFKQVDTIKKLKEENAKLKKSAIVLNSFADEILKLNKLKGYSKLPKPEIEVARVIAYAKPPYFQKIWIDFKDYNSSKFYGLIYNNQAAGIVIDGSNKAAQALLNGDPKCSYAVFVGKQKAPGIAMGLNDKKMIVRYIPSWMSIKVKDKVITSGLDNIFFAGIEVGEVESIRTKNAYKEAIIKPYFNSLNPSYFYVIKKVR